MEEKESEATAARFKRKEKAPKPSFGWRWIFPLFIAAAVTWSAVLIFESGDQLLDSQNGETLDAVTDPTAPGFEAFVEQTWSMAVATEDNEGNLVNLIIGAVADRELGGGSVLIVPPALNLDRDCQQSPCDLRSVYKEGGLNALTLVLIDLFGVSFSEEVLLTSSRWAGLISPVTGVEVDLEEALIEVTDAGTEITHFPEGQISIAGDEVIEFFSFSGDGNQVDRGKSFWDSWLQELGEAENPLEKLPDLGLNIVDFLAVVTSGEIGLVTFPIADSESSFFPDEERLQTLVVDLFPFPIAAVPGERLTVRLINGTGDFTLDSIARKQIVSAGAEIIVVGNSESFDVQESKVVYRDPMVAEEAEVLGAQLGFPVEFNELISPVTEVTVVIGADFVPALS
ncbi:MAG: LytR C-terminal domain-containing protein [Acidimicrobiales bacterium]|nr:LytR C-terminal domain-containing protein [Acidimicrobiales bacterium]